MAEPGLSFSASFSEVISHPRSPRTDWISSFETSSIFLPPLETSLAGKGGGEEETRALYDRTWKKALGIAGRAGATRSHHHGVGILKQDGMEREHAAFMRALRAFKKAVDPAWISNPGKLGLGTEPP